MCRRHFFIDIKNNAVEQLSNIKQNKYAVQEGEFADKYGFDITLTDFIVGQRTYQGHGTYRLEITELQDFSQMLKTSYEELAEEAEISTTDYILQIFENGEYGHSKYHPVRDFISGLLDTATLGILPMVELMAGYDFITGEELSSQEATNKGIEAVMGLVAIALIPFTSGGSVGLKAVGKQILVESATGVVSYTLYEAGEAMDMPAGITFVLSIAGGGLTYKALDGGIPHVKREGVDEVVISGGKPSTVETLTSNSVRAVIEENGISIEKFMELLDPNRVLSDAEIDIVNKIRMDIGLPIEGTIMNKTIPQSDIYKYLYDPNYSGVRGFVSVDEHSSLLVGLNGIYEGNRLDYNNTAFKIGYGVDGISQSVGKPDTVYGKITYILTDGDSVKIPADIATVDNAPYTGRGFTGSKNIVLPELVQSPRNFIDGDILGIYDSNTGELVRQFIYDEELGWLMK